MTCIDATCSQPTLMEAIAELEAQFRASPDVPARRPQQDATDTIRRRNPKKQGLIGLGDAIAWFTAQGYEVLLPLNDSQKYDLAIEEDDGTLRKVQVKTVTRLTPYGSFQVDLATNGGNKSRYRSDPFDPSHYELLFVLTDDGSRYLIPSEAIEARFSICLGEKWRPYLVD